MDNAVKITSLVANLFIIGIALVLFLAFNPLPDREEQDEESEVELTENEMDVARNLLIETWASAGLTNVDEVITEGEAILVDDQASVDVLTDISKKANAAANYVGYIQEEYSKYYRENYKYSFIQDKVVGPHDAYVGKANRLKDIRNQAFLKIGKKLEADGDLGGAFFHYRDAFRLADFDNNGKNGTRYLAEQEMKRLLGLEEMPSYGKWTD